MKRLQIAAMSLALFLVGCKMCFNPAHEHMAASVPKPVQTTVNGAADFAAGSAYGITKYATVKEPWVDEFLKHEGERILALTGAPSEEQKAKVEERAETVKENFGKNEEKIKDLYEKERKDGEITKQAVLDSISMLTEDAMKKWTREQEEIRKASFQKWCMIFGIALVVFSIAAYGAAKRLAIKPMFSPLAAICGGILLLLPRFLDTVSWFLPSIGVVLFITLIGYIVELFFKHKADKKNAES